MKSLISVTEEKSEMWGLDSIIEIKNDALDIKSKEGQETLHVRVGIKARIYTTGSRQRGGLQVIKIS